MLPAAPSGSREPILTTQAESAVRSHQLKEMGRDIPARPCQFSPRSALGLALSGSRGFPTPLTHRPRLTAAAPEPSSPRRTGRRQLGSRWNRRTLTKGRKWLPRKEPGTNSTEERPRYNWGLRRRGSRVRPPSAGSQTQGCQGVNERRRENGPKRFASGTWTVFPP